MTDKGGKVYGTDGIDCTAVKKVLKIVNDCKRYREPDEFYDYDATYEADAVELIGSFCTEYLATRQACEGAELTE